VIVALPCATAVTVNPLTEATLVLLELLDVTLPPDASERVNVGFFDSDNVCVAVVVDEAAAICFFSYQRIPTVMAIETPIPKSDSLSQGSTT
jgi:hypothetical protein